MIGADESDDIKTGSLWLGDEANYWETRGRSG